jgi:hypothetical protein
MSFTYQELKSAIQDYTENNETSFVDNLPVFIRNAEERLLKNVQLTNFRKNSTGIITDGNQYLSLPTDFLSPFSLSFGSSKVFLEYKDVNFLQTFHPDATVKGSPKYYAFFDINSLLLAPTPDSNYAVELHYFYRPVSLTAGADSATTWLSEEAPVALLFGCLLEAYTYMKGEADLMQEYEKRFADAIIYMKQFGEAKEVTDQYRTGMIMRPKQ